MDSHRTVIFDFGSDTCKAGFAGDAEPSVLVTTLVGRVNKRELAEATTNPLLLMSRRQQAAAAAAAASTSSSPVTPSASNAAAAAAIDTPLAALAVDGMVFGNVARLKANACVVSNPYHNATVDNWEEFEALWAHMYRELKVKSSEHPVLVAEPPLHARPSRERMGEILFEKFGAPSAFFALQGLLALYATGRVTGLVLEAGDTQMHAVPVFDGYAIASALEVTKLGGRDVTEQLVRLLADQHVFISATTEREAVKKAKETYGFLSSNHARDVATTKPVSVQLGEGGGRIVDMHSELYKCGEVLFEPARLLGIEALGAADLVLSSINKCEMDIRPELFNSIVCSGGTTCFQGFGSRLQDAIAQRASYARAKIVLPKDRRYGVWDGASTFASFSVFPQLRITKEEYEEYGASILHSRM